MGDVGQKRPLPLKPLVSAVVGLAAVLGGYAMLTSTNIVTYFIVFVLGAFWALSMIGVAAFLLSKIYLDEPNPKTCAFSPSSALSFRG